MASADFWRSFPTPRDAGSTWQTTRSPRVWRTHLPAYACRIYVAAFRARIGLCIYWPAYPAAPPLSASCSSGQRFAYSFLQIPPRDGHPCRSANTSPCRVCRGLSPPSECALWYLHSHFEWLKLSYSSIQFLLCVCFAAHARSFLDGLPDLSNFACLPGRAGSN